MRSTRLASLFHRARVIKHVLGAIRRSVADRMPCSYISLQGPILTEPLSCQLLAGGPHKGAIGTDRHLTTMFE